MKWLVLVLSLSLAAMGSAWAKNNKGQGKGRGPGSQVETPTGTVQDILEDILGEDDEDQGRGPGGKGRGQGGDVDDDQGGLGSILVDVIFGEEEQETIGNYYSKNRVNVDTLPPGIAKNLARGKPLPPGIAKKNLPDDLNSQLPGLSGFQRIIAGADILLVDEKTNIVVDILTGILNR